MSYVDRDPRLVDYVEVKDVPAEIPTAWHRLEDVVGDLRGRHFAATVDARAGRYRACVDVEPSDATPRGLSRGEIPGGRYGRVRLRGDPPGLYEQIPAAVDHLMATCDMDDERPIVEVYHRHDQVDALVPVTIRAGETGGPSTRAG